MSPVFSERVYWFGFDCAHAGDLSPGMMRYYPNILRRDTYKNLGFILVESANSPASCTRLQANTDVQK